MSWISSWLSLRGLPRFLFNMMAGLADLVRHGHLCLIGSFVSPPDRLNRSDYDRRSVFRVAVLNHRRQPLHHDPK